MKNDPKIGSKEIRKCEGGCGEVKECEYAEDPYSAEINDDHTPEWECADCRSNHADDI